MFVLALIGCGVTEWLGGQSGNEGGGSGFACEEVSRTPLAADDVADGFAHAPADMVAAAGGAWVGWWTSAADGPLVDAALEARFEHAGADLVEFHLVGSQRLDDGGFVLIDEPSPECPSRYEATAQGVWTAAGGVEVALPVLVFTTAAFAGNSHDLQLRGTALADAVQGHRHVADREADAEAELSASLDVTGTLYGQIDVVGPDRELLGGFSLSRPP